MELNASDVKAFRDAVFGAKHVIITSHLNPDGDALGSAMAVYHALHDAGVSCEVVNNNSAPYNLKFLPGIEMMKEQPSRKGDVSIVLDLNNLDRIGRPFEAVSECRTMIVIDHHVPHETPGDIRIVDESAPATALILTRLFQQLELRISPEVATCLLTGIVTDTGSFRFRNTTPESLECGAFLLEHGADIVKICEEVYMKQPMEAVRLTGIALSQMRLSMDDRIAWTVLTEDAFADTGATEVHTEGLTNELLAIDSVQIAAVIRQPIGGVIRASIRSREQYDISVVARLFGGGGHRNASGCTFTGTIESAETDLVKELERCLGS